MPSQLLILGTGPFAEEVADLAADCAMRVVGFVEGLDRSRCASTLRGLPILFIDEVERVADGVLAACAVGSTRREAFIAQGKAHGLRFTRIVHPSAHVAPSARIEEGAIVGAAAVVGAETRIGAFAILNRGCLVGHHVRVGRFVTLGPGTNVGGLSAIGDGTFVGMSATILDRIAVGEGAVIAAGSLVAKDVGAGSQVAGSPARVVRSEVERA